MTEPDAVAAASESTAAATSLVAAGMMVMNVCVYGFTLISAHTLGPRSFGAVSALLGVLIVANVGSLALQATAARRIATAQPASRDAVGHDLVVNTWHVALGLILLGLALTPVLAHMLHVSALAAAMVGLTVGPLTMVGGYAGVLQGSRRWTWLAATYVVLGLGRLVAGGLALVVDQSVGAAMIGIAIGSAAPALVGWFGCRSVPHGATGRHAPALIEVWRNGHSLLAFFALTNVDVLLARHLFTHLDAGIYAAGSVIAKSCLFLPQFVIVVAFPGMAQDQAANSSDRAWLRPLVIVGALGLLAVAGTAVLRDLAVTFVGGSEYAALADYAWLFALEGTMFALLQLMVYRQIARQAHVAVFLWVAVLAVVTYAQLFVGSNQELALALVAAVALVAMPLAIAKPSGRATLVFPPVPGSEHNIG